MHETRTFKRRGPLVIASQQIPFETRIPRGDVITASPRRNLVPHLRRHSFEYAVPLEKLVWSEKDSMALSASRFHEFMQHTMRATWFFATIVAGPALAAQEPARTAATAIETLLSAAPLPSRLEPMAGATRSVRRRFACLTLMGLRTEVSRASRDSAEVHVTVDGIGELPVTHAVAPVAANWDVRLTRAGARWRVARIEVAESALADALIGARSTAERNTLLDARPDADRIELVRQLVEKGFAIDVKGQFDRAEAIAEIALTVARDGANDDAVARAMWLRGRARDGENRIDEALADYEVSRRLAEGSGDRETVAASLVGHGALTMEKGDGDRGLAEVKQARDEALSIGNDSLTATALLIIGNQQQFAGDYIGSLRTHAEARAHAERAGDLLIEAAALANAGITYDRMNNFDIAQYFLLRGIRAYRRLGNVRGVIRNLRNLADIELEVYHFDRTEGYLDQIDRLLASHPDQRIRAYAALTRAKLAVARHHFEAADRLFTIARTIGQAINDQHFEAYVGRSLADFRFDQHRYEEAIEIEAEVSRLAKSFDADIYCKSRLNAARAYRLAGRLTEAKAACADAIAVIETIRANVPANGDEQTFFHDKRFAYHEMFRIVVASDPRGALEWAERARGRSLLDYLARRGMASAVDHTEAERKEEARLEAHIRELNENLVDAWTRQPVDALRAGELARDLRRAHVERDELSSRFNQHPRQWLARGEVPRPTFEQLQRSIPPDGAVAEFVTAPDMSWLVVITSHGAPRVFPIRMSMNRIDTEVSRFVAHLSVDAHGLRPLSRKLYDLFLKAAESELAGKKTICLIPDGSLWRLPFQALVAGDGKYVIEHHAIFYTPSVAVLAWYESHSHDRQPAHRGALVIGNPKLRHDTILLAHAVRRSESLGPLPGAEREARTVASIYGDAAQLLTGSDATEARFKAMAGRFRVLHLATHGMYDDANPMYSHIALARAENDAEDGLLEAREIVDLDLHADLVVLSGCETGRGQARGGEGMLGIAWAVLAAGCPTLVVTQSKVPESAAELMIAFHRHLAASKSLEARTATQALHDAQLAMIRSKSFARPFHWAAFMVIGRGW